MLIEILVLLFFLVASLYLAYQFRSCGQQMGILQGSNASLSADLVSILVFVELALDG